MTKNVFLIRNVAPKMYGGGETYQIKLAQLLKGNGFNPFILSASEKLLLEAKKNSIETIKTPYITNQNWSGWKNILFPIYFFKIMKLRKWYKAVFEKYQPETINIQSRDDWIAATRVAKKMNIKVLWTDHIDFRSWVLVNVNVWYKNLIGKWILKNAKIADNIILISDYERNWFTKAVAPKHFKNVVVIKNGSIDEYDIYKNIKPKENSICYIGRIVDYKGIKELLEAFEIANQQFPNILLNIYGEGEDFRHYKELAKTNNQIKFYGQTDKPLEKMAENEIFILPSYREGLSLSLLDAIMMKKIIIASNIDGNSEIIKNNETGLLVPAKNTKKLAEAIIYVLEHKRQSELLAGNARKQYEKEFDFTNIFKKQMLPLYNIEKEKR